jgi:hypothetical protein
MRSDILLLELKRMRYKVKLASEDPEKTPVRESEEMGEEKTIDQITQPLGGSFTWSGPDYKTEDWDSEPDTKVSVDPAKARDKVKRYLERLNATEPTKLTESELNSLLDSMTEREIQNMQGRIDSYHFSQSEAGRGMIPGTGGMMTEESRRQGLERIRRDRPELFDSAKKREMNNYKQSYYTYYDPLFKGERKTEFSERRRAARDYKPVKINQELADQLSGLIGDLLVGKRFTISTGSPIMPREEVVTILDVDPDDQKIIFKPVGPGVSLFSSYDDFFYNTVGRKENKSDGERALLQADPTFKMPPKDPGVLSRAWKNLLKIFPSRAKS